MSNATVLERGLELLEFLTETPRGASLGDLSERAGLSKSATHRVLSMLVESGFVTQCVNRDYRLTMKMTALGFRFLAKTGLVEHCHGSLNGLAADLEELVRMTIVDCDRLVWVAKAQGARGSLVVDPGLGREVALHATATGKVWLASLPTDDAITIVLRHGFGTPQQHGPNVLQSVEDLLEELKVTRERGYGLAWEEAESGIAAVAVGFSATAEKETPLMGTVSVACPIVRVTRERLLEFVPRLREISRGLLDVGSVLQLWRQTSYNFNDVNDAFAVSGKLRPSAGVVPRHERFDF